jgi:tetratricopeptide (TPR) repeat protein
VSKRHSKLIGTTLIAAVLAGGCATPSNQPARLANPAVDGPSSIPKKDRVLWQYRTALSAMRAGNFQQAKALLDDAILTISNIYGKDASAKKARGYFNEESKKNFLGEPYERVMAYWYRGILYWMEGEPDNARACFRSAQLIDSDTENKEFSADYATLDYLDGYASVKLDADGADAFNRAQKLSKIGGLPPYNKKANTLVFFEFGQGPTKYSTGEHSEQLRFRTQPSPISGAWFRVANKAVRIGAYDDLNFQATTRGGRVMDHVLANKAVFKSATDSFGDAAIIGGAVAAGTARNNDVGAVGLGLIAAGIISKVVAAATTPQADTRSWDNLPQYLSFAALELPPGEHTANIEFLDPAGNPITTLVKQVKFTVNAPGGPDTVLFISDKVN